jgi:hypothetical protein
MAKNRSRIKGFKVRAYPPSIISSRWRKIEAE